MFVQLLKWLRGYLIIRISGASKERFINICSKNQIIMWTVSRTDDYIEGYISRKDFGRIESFVAKTDVKIDIRDKKGLPHFFYKYRKRKGFAIGLILCLAIIYTFTLFIWDINVSGESVYTKEQIVKDIKANYVELGTLKKDVNCFELEKELRQKYDKVAWISCEIKGTQLNITFTETIEPDTIKEQTEPCNIVAAKDGVITEIITRSGTSVVVAGDEVKKGDILITGAINIYNDYDELIETTYIPASGDVYAISEYEYSDSFPMNYYKKQYTGESKKYISLNFFENHFTPYTPKTSYELYDTVTNDNKLKIGDSFYLPFSFQTTCISEYTTEAACYTDEQAHEKAMKRLNVYLDDLRKKGVEILENNVTIEVSNGTCTAEGYIVTKEPIGVPAELIIMEQGEEP